MPPRESRDSNMDSDTYAYDVAFSFLAEDESLASALNDLLSDRLSTFLYTQRQSELAGSDGEKTLNEVFGEAARIVVVLHRGKWGTTSWTRIEETAIRNRAYDKGYDFALFIPLGDVPELPQWVPKTEIWIGLERWGLEGAASVIEAKVQSRGGEPTEETAVEQAARLGREIEANEDREAFLRSQSAVDSAATELGVLFDEFDSLVQEVRKRVPSQDILGKRDDSSRRSYSLIVNGLCVTVAWSQQYSNSLQHSSLYVKSWDGPVGRHYASSPRELRSRDFDFDVGRGGEIGWREHKGDARLLTTRRLADLIMKDVLDHVRSNELS